MTRVQIFNPLMTTSGPGTPQVRLEYDVDDLLIYVGYAAMGVSSSTSEWTLYKLTYSGTNLTLKQSAFDSWDNRADANYE